MKINKYIDSTLLRPDAAKEEIIAFCQEAVKYNFAAVCVHNSRVGLARSVIKDAPVGISGTVGFPFGNNPVEVKVHESQYALQQGATEIDFVQNLGFVKDHQWEKLDTEFRAMRTNLPQTTLKVILENSLLTKEEMVKCCELAMKNQIDFIKTSTGYSTSGATIEDVKLMKSVVGDHCQIKAAGGIQNLQQAETFLQLGVSRIGTSHGITIIAEQEKNGD